jgi:hypothetical protein
VFRSPKAKGVKDQRFSLGVKDTAKCPLVLAFAVHVQHINDVKIARAHKVMDVAAGFQ